MSAIRRRKLLFLTACSSVEPAPQRTESDMSSDHSNDHGHGKSARCRDIYLKIEKLPAYSPVAPENGEHDRYGRDCMRNHGHENGRIPQAEIERRRVDAVVYREYLDPGYTVPNLAKLVEDDLIEPR